VPEAEHWKTNRQDKASAPKFGLAKKAAPKKRAASEMCEAMCGDV